MGFSAAIDCIRRPDDKQLGPALSIAVCGILSDLSNISRTGKCASKRTGVIPLAMLTPNMGG